MDDTAEARLEALARDHLLLKARSAALEWTLIRFLAADMAARDADEVRVFLNEIMHGPTSVAATSASGPRALSPAMSEDVRTACTHLAEAIQAQAIRDRAAR